MKCNWKFIGLHGDKAAPESKFSVSPVLKELEMELKLAVPLDFFVITTRGTSPQFTSADGHPLEGQLQWGDTVSGIIVYTQNNDDNCTSVCQSVIRLCACCMQHLPPFSPPLIMLMSFRPLLYLETPIFSANNNNNEKVFLSRIFRALDFIFFG